MPHPRIAAALACAVVLAACSDPAPPPPPSAALTVGVTQPRSVPFDHAVHADGSIAARDETIVGARSAGLTVDEVRVEEGARVRRGDLLARLNTDLLRAQLRQQEAGIKEARAALAEAEANLKRALSLRDRGFISGAGLDADRARADAAAARLELGQAQRDETLTRLRQADILAPDDGVISHRTATVGMVVNPGTELFRLIRGERLEWRAEVPEQDVLRVRTGMPVRLAVPGSTDLDARVREVSPVVDPLRRQGTVFVDLPPGAALKAGMFVEGRIVTGRTPVLAVPDAAVLSRDGNDFAFVLRGAGAEPVAESVRVQVGARQSGMTEIRAGLAAADRVVVQGAGFLKSGNRVRVAPGAAGKP
ncbi:MAG: efflux RND transporter periplasmic adaptor subunit [Gammaproteobacteria bacterium]